MYICIYIYEYICIYIGLTPTQHLIPLTPTTAAGPQRLTPTQRHHYNKKGGRARRRTAPTDLDQNWATQARPRRRASARGPVQRHVDAGFSCLCVFCVGPLCGPPLRWWVLCGALPSVWVPCVGPLCGFPVGVPSVSIPCVWVSRRAAFMWHLLA